MSYILGVDGGATKTIALIAERSGRVLGAGRSGSSDIHNEPSAEIAIENVAASVREAATAASVDLADLAASVLGLCGADWPEDVELYRGTLSARLRMLPPTIVNDAFNTLRAGTADGVGVAVVMGTGGAISARGPRGATWFSGERMEATGALEFGRWAFDRLIRGEYGSGLEPAFQAAALQAYDVTSVEELIHTVTRSGGLGRRSLSRLAPIVLQAGHSGDPEVVRLLAGHGAFLAGYVRRASERVALVADGASVTLAGGLFKHHGTELRGAIETALPEYRINACRLEPAYGAVLAAADTLGWQPDADTLVSTGPAASVFDTAG